MRRMPLIPSSNSFNQMHQEIAIRSRRGEGYLLLSVVLLGLTLIILSLTIDGLGLAVTYRRAVGLASVGAQAGASAVAPFDGNAVTLSANACTVAIDTVMASLPAGVTPNAVQASCDQSQNRVNMTVELTPLRFFGGPLTLSINRVRAQVSAAPKFGINTQEN